jgi:putative phosphoribosyl transferase
MRTEPAIEPFHLRLSDVELEGELVLPPRCVGVVVFAHGSGSSRFSPRNRAVARVLERASIGTLLLDLLSAREDADEQAGAMRRFDVGLLADRLVAVTDALDPHLSVAYFGASTGAAAALVAASARPERIAAVVSRGGRPDLASNEALAAVRAPTLLLVGSRDLEVLARNRAAHRKMRCVRELRVIEGATHLFEEAGALDEVARLARNWFLRFLAAPAARRAG